MAEIQRIACVSLVVVAPSRVAELSPTQRDVITARGLIRGFQVICRAGSKHAPQRLRQARARADAAPHPPTQPRPTERDPRITPGVFRTFLMV